MIPENGASMHDAGRTRENEPGGICDCCNEPDDCQRNPRHCEELATEDWGERQFEARRDGE